MKKFSDLMEQVSKEPTNLQKAKSHFASHGVQVSKVSAIKGGHRMRLVPHFTDNDRSEQQFGGKVDKAIAASSHKVTKVSSGEATRETLASIGRTPSASTPKNPYHVVDVHY